MIEIEKASKPSQMLEIFEIRRQVFVLEQEVSPDEEYDEHEKSSTHFLAKYKGVSAGTCRFRTTDKGFKLERFAVLSTYRGKGIGAVLVKKCLENLPLNDTYVYLHAQLHAIPFYEKFGFRITGPQFSEAGIEHFKMYYVSENNSL
jgi:predicted GNAT family N-acyltransferase